MFVYIRNGGRGPGPDTPQERAYDGSDRRDTVRRRSEAVVRPPAVRGATGSGLAGLLLRKGCLTERQKAEHPAGPCGDC